MATITIQFANGRTKTLSAREVRNGARLTALLFVAVFMIEIIPFRHIIHARTVAALRPTMERIANHGGVDADMWLFWHFDEGSRLQAAAQAGDPAAQYQQGRLLIHRGHRRAGLGLIRRSAEAGYPCAVLREDLHRVCE